MNHLNNNKKYMIGLCFLIICVASFLFINTTNKTNLIKREHKKLLSIPSNYTAEQILKSKMADVDVTHILNNENKVISNFLFNVKSNKWAVLKTISSNKDGLNVTLYIYDDRISKIMAYKYYVNRQAEEAPYRLFKSYYSTTSKDTTTIYLISMINPLTMNNILPKDQILYNYKINN